ncbi:MAG: secondary thiamine-phosphate synthase enzyme YjbQ [Christensenellales bacterium]|jgi:secondary thiamine-phosphate synthase enzyme
MKKTVLQIETKQRYGYYDITEQVKKVVKESGVQDGICVVFVPHTTAGVNINENCDANVTKDLTAAFQACVPDVDFKHDEGNSDGHFCTALVGSSETIIIEEGALQLGVWQAIFFVEFDGPRTRQAYIKIMQS